MEVRQIRDFVAVVRCSSFAAASRDLRVSQPGLGYQVKQLEQELRVQLLQRHARGVSLTSAGRIFMNHAENILSAVEDAKIAMATIAGGQRREVAIGLSPSLAHVLGALLLNVDIMHGLKVRLHEGSSEELQNNLARGDLDLAICLNPAPAPLKTVPIYDEALYLIGPFSQETSERRDVTLAEVADFPLILGQRGHVLRRTLEDAATREGVSLKIAHELRMGSLHRSLVLRSGGYTVSAFSMFAEEIEKGLLRAWRIVEPDLTQTVNMICGAGIDPALERTVLSVMRSLASYVQRDHAALDCMAIAAE